MFKSFFKVLKRAFRGDQGRSLEYFSGVLPADFPPCYSGQLYAQLHPDLANLTPIELKTHWESYGIEEGRRSYPFLNRQGLASFFPESKSVLEISPFTSPFFVGPNVQYADVLDTDSLRERAKTLGLDSAAIPEINYVVEPTNLTKMISRKFDLVASSHVIEHQPNLLEHLRQVGQLLHESGQYVVVVPDKRYCFDHFLPETSVADLLDADVSGRTRHTLKSVIDHEAFTTHNEPARHWKGDHGTSDVDLEKVNKALRKFTKAEDSYIDVHSFCFTPKSFEQLMEQTFGLGFQPFKVKTMYHTYRNNLEFYALLELSR